jgi:hypothetical protein
MCSIIYCALLIQILVFNNSVLLFEYTTLYEAEPCNLALRYNLKLLERTNSACIMDSAHLTSYGSFIYSLSVNDLFGNNSFLFHLQVFASPSPLVISNLLLLCIPYVLIPLI